MSKQVIESLIRLYHCDLKKLKEEIALYKEETNLWKIQGSIPNSGGNLCLHVIGNLKTYIGNGLNNNGYERDRAFEFSAKDIDRIQLYKELDETLAIVNQGLQSLDDEKIDSKFPIQIWEKETGTTYTLLHLHAHLNYHLGQINYHRRMIE